MLELDEGQLSRPVLRGRGGSNTSPLPDSAAAGSTRRVSPNEPGKGPGSVRVVSPNEPSKGAGESTEIPEETWGWDAGPGRPDLVAFEDLPPVKTSDERDWGMPSGILDRYPELRDKLMQGVRPRPG